MRVTLDGYSAGDTGARRLAKKLGQLVHEILREKTDATPSEKEIVSWVREILDRTEVLCIVGKGDTLPSVDDTSSAWEKHATWILVGGEILGRGITLPNLLTTYMPRGRPIQSRTIDTLQQRARFFGYRASYLPLLSGAFHSDTLADFAELAEVEPAMLRILKTVDLRGGDFRSAPHFVPQGFNGQAATRRQAMSAAARVLNIGRRGGSAWPVVQNSSSAASRVSCMAFIQRLTPHTDGEAISTQAFPSAVELLEEFSGINGWQWDIGDRYGQLIPILEWLFKSLPATEVPEAEMITQWVRSDNSEHLTRSIRPLNAPGPEFSPGEVLQSNQRAKAPGTKKLQIFVQVFDLLKAGDGRTARGPKDIALSQAPFAAIWLADSLRQRVTALQ